MSKSHKFWYAVFSFSSSSQFYAFISLDYFPSDSHWYNLSNQVQSSRTLPGTRICGWHLYRQHPRMWSEQGEFFSLDIENQSQIEISKAYNWHIILTALELRSFHNRNILQVHNTSSFSISLIRPPIHHTLCRTQWDI